MPEETLIKKVEQKPDLKNVLDSLPENEPQPEKREAQPKIENRIEQGTRLERQAIKKSLESMPAAQAIPQAKQALLSQEIEKILSDGLNEIFLSMNPQQQKKFKTQGEETVKKINHLMSKTKVKVGSIIKLIRKWLSLIPGVNRFFLEQEAKIRAERIIKLKR